MKTRAFHILVEIVISAFVLVGHATVRADDAACLKCHKEFATSMVGKPAEPISCADCHRGLDGASTPPHKSSTAFAGGLSAKGADSCLACHQKEAYTKLRHGSLGAGCTGCHSAHDKKHGKMVEDELADTCYTCHDRKKLTAKVTHKPVAGGDCADCHEVHATEHAGLLSNPPVESCLSCHGKVKKQIHVAVGIGPKRTGHPVGGEKEGVQDPARPGQPFQCASCHDPHKSDAKGLMRFDVRQPTGFCQKCHRI